MPGSDVLRRRTIDATLGLLAESNRIYILANDCISQMLEKNNFSLLWNERLLLFSNILLVQLQKQSVIAHS